MGIPIRMDIHFRAAFLDIVIVHKLEQERTNNLQSRGIVGLVLGRDKSGRGAITVLNLETMKLCKRYHFKLVESESLSKYVDQQLQEPLFKASYIAADDSEIATADIEDFEISIEDIAAVHEEIARRSLSKKTVSNVEGGGAKTLPTAAPKNKKKPQENS